MKTKEEAEKIVEKFRPHADMWDCYHDAPSQDKNDIKCAIIHVEGIIGTLEEIKLLEYTTFWHNENNMDGFEVLAFYKQVLTELKKM